MKDKAKLSTDKELTVGIVQGLWNALMNTGRYEDVSITHDPDDDGSINIEARRKK